MEVKYQVGTSATVVLGSGSMGVEVKSHIGIRTRGRYIHFRSVKLTSPRIAVTDISPAKLPRLMNEVSQYLIPFN